MTPAILCVDDERSILEAYGWVFDEYEVLKALGVLPAQEFVRQRQADIGAIITDQRMPDGSGQDFLEWLQEQYHGSPPPCFIITANEGSLDPQRMYGARVLGKPFDNHEIRSLVIGAMSGTLPPR